VIYTEKELLIFDVGGVFRNSSKALDEGYRRGFQSVGLAYNFNTIDTWHLRGLDKYNDSLECIKALLAFTLQNKRDLGEILATKDAEHKIGLIVEKAIGDKESKNAEQIELVYKSFFHSQAAKPLIQMFPGSEDILEILSKSKNYELAIFTNSSVTTVKRDLSFLGLDKFAMVLSEEDVLHKKPSGEGIRKIIDELGADPAKTYYVGDSVSDILAARDARCRAIAILWGMGTKQHLEMAKPDLVFADLLEMCNRFTMKKRIRH
jgi:pyrophosphatase PpaX